MREPSLLTDTITIEQINKLVKTLEKNYSLFEMSFPNPNGGQLLLFEPDVIYPPPRGKTIQFNFFDYEVSYTTVDKESENK